jgi:SNF2 family DNA or RNA helicase
MEIQPLDGGLFSISHSSFSPALSRAAKTIPGIRSANRSFVGFPDAIEAVANLLLEQRLRFEPGKGPEVLEKAKRKDVTGLVAIAEKDLRKYQLGGVRFLLNTGKQGCILAFQMGTGKSATATRAARALNRNTVIVCPAAVKGVSVDTRSWRRELHLWWPKAKVFFPEGVKHTSEIPLDAQAIVINYDILYAWLSAILKWRPKVAILDEGHILSGTQSEPSKKSRRGLACESLLLACEYRWMLTGTPLLNYPKDLWGIVSALCPGRFGPPDGFFKYGYRYCGAHKKLIEAIDKTVWDFSGYSHEAELKARFGWFMLRKQMSDPDVAMELPPKVRMVKWIEPRKRGRGSSRAIHNRRELRAALDAASDAKLEPVAQLLVKEGYSPGGVVIFCWRKAVVDFIAEAYRSAGLTNVEIITGEVPQKTREKRIAKSRSTSGVLVVTIDSCGLGIDLTHASRGDFVEFVHEPWKFTQAESRIHRFGQERNTALRYFAMSGSADELIIDRVVNKLEVIDAVVGASDEEKSLQAKLAGEGLSEEDILKDIFAGVET